MENPYIKAALQIWDLQVMRTGKILDMLTGDDFLKEIAPGKNRAIYVLGHLIAVSDAMSEIIGTGKKAYPELYATFVQNPDRSGMETPTGDELKSYWNEVSERLRAELLTVSDEEWLSRHNTVNDEDFAKDRSRNKLSVLLNRTNHLAFHLGQLRLLI
jgi:uncharacterized damage-inducible protein DinB